MVSVPCLLSLQLHTNVWKVSINTYICSWNRNSNLWSQLTHRRRQHKQTPAFHLIRTVCPSTRPYVTFCFIAVSGVLGLQRRCRTTPCRLSATAYSQLSSTFGAISRGELSYLAPLGSENISVPYFKQCFFRGGGLPLPPRLSQTPCLPVPREK